MLQNAVEIETFLQTKKIVALVRFHLYLSRSIGRFCQSFTFTLPTIGHLTFTLLYFTLPTIGHHCESLSGKTIHCQMLQALNLKWHNKSQKGI